MLLSSDKIRHSRAKSKLLKLPLTWVGKDTKDIHLPIPSDKIVTVTQHFVAPQLTIADEVIVRGKQYLLLTTEDYGRPIMLKS